MSIVINSEDLNNLSKLFNLEKNWLIGKDILYNHQNNNQLFNLTENQSSNDESNEQTSFNEIERIHNLTQQLISKPNRTCLSDLSKSNENHRTKVLSRIIPSQNVLFELTLNQPDSSRWILTYPDEENDDGFQSASSILSDDDDLKLSNEKNEVNDYWSKALTQTENRYFTWEQRGSFLYDRTRPYLFDLRLNDRPFQHLCLLLLLNKSKPIDYQPISIEEFLRDLCYMLMSISSQTFQWNEINQTFELQSDIYVLGYTRVTIEQFSLKYLRAGERFYRIKNYISQSTNLSETESEFSQSLKYYLRFIQRSISNHDIQKYSLVQFAAELDPIISSLDFPLSLLSTIIELEQTIHNSSPTTSKSFVKLSAILHTLLNEHSQTINSNYFLLLLHFVSYTIRPLLKFLTNLILDSNYLDRNNEYPILFNYNRLIGLKTKDFWTKIFTIRYLYSNTIESTFYQIIPIEYLQQIVNITRSLMLIKLCDQNHPLCQINHVHKPELKFQNINSIENLEQYELEMKENIQQYEQLQKKKREDIEQAKIRERMDMYARQDEQRAQRKKLAEDAKQRILNEKLNLRDRWQEQIDEKQKQIREEKLAESIANAELNKPNIITTIIGSKMAAPYADLVEDVRKEIIAEYDAKMRDASQREEQFRKRLQSTENPTVISSDAPVDLPPATTTEQLPEVISTVDVIVEPIVKIEKPVQIIDKVSLIPSEPTQIFVRHTANEQTTQAEYRPGIKLVPSNVLKSTIQNYMIDHDPLENEKEEEELPEKIYDWDAIISNGPQFKYDDSFDFTLEEKKSTPSNSSWFDYDLSPLRVWLEHSISPLIHIQSRLVNRALLNYFFDELNLLTHFNNLRAYYFLATGRFGLAFCSELSRILLSDDDARKIYHVNSMRQILYSSLDQTGDLNHLIDILQLTSKADIPNSLSLLDANLFDYFDLKYTIQWPMNIVISDEMIEKYKVIFRFLLRILIVKQILNEIWIMLKSCKKQNSTLAQLHQYRHQMQHFMTVFINYITNQVIQIAWNEFIRKIQQAKHINEITNAHNEYLDRTMLNCLLTPNAAPILNEVNRVLTLIIRFRCQLKTFSWLLDATYTDISDTSIQALRTTFEKYHIAVLSLFKVLSKLVEKGYKTSLNDLLVRLNLNGYYDRIAMSSNRR